jgi:hypothetical protein
MLHRLIYADWEDPPEAMAFELSYREALGAVQNRLAIVQAGSDAALTAPSTAPASFWEACLDLYLLTPALVNVALNFKVCVEHGLPLHPTHYFEVSEHTRGRVAHAPALLEGAQAFFLEAIDASLAVFRLDRTAPARLGALASDIPAGVGDFVYTSTRDKYTWRASEPAKIQDLAEEVQSRVQPVVVVGAAHGSITSALVLATLLETPLYFIRFSMFKRNDAQPVIGPTDLRFLARYRRGPTLLFDEDVAKGTTLTQFTRHLRPLFEESYSAGVLRHGYAGFHPDFVGRVWYD